MWPRRLGTQYRPPVGTGDQLWPDIFHKMGEFLKIQLKIAKMKCDANSEKTRVK